ncbi:uncharacterized protein PFD1115c-like [Polistes fuscatus]|uniref:uncharacterized protein PFD1115c-like n=1 Tax=Polistes fuscatus TaxID=30207 RepID=UPI001CA870B7|nr:uncharacterized protein PFD1115c-like [Polistes fuscatus]
MVKQRCCKWIWIPLIILSILTIIESKRRHKRAFSVSHNYQQQQQQQHIISKENHQDLTSNSILTPNKKSLHVNASEETIMITATTSLFDVNKIVKKKTLLDLEKLTLLDDINKRFDLNELSNETHIRVKRTDSEFENHPKSLIHLRNNYLEDLANSFSRKTSNDFNEYYNTSNYLDVYSSNSNETFVNNHITETNHYFNNPINDSILSKMCCNDDENKIGKDDLIISNFAEVNKTRFKRDNKSNNNARRRVGGHGKKRKMKKHSGGKGKKKGNSFKAGNKRHPNSLKTMSHFKSKRTSHMIRNNSPEIIDDYKIKSKIEMKDSSNDKSNIDDISYKKDTTDNKRSSRERNDNEQAEETSIKERKDVIVNDSVRDKRSLRKKDDIVFAKSGMISSWASKNGKFRSKRNGSKDLIIPNYPNVLETSSSLSILSENQLSNEKPRADRAVKSIEEIKELAEKLVSKVNELQNYLKENKKKKLESREIVEVPRDNKTVEEEVVLESPKLVDECVRIGDLSSALKTLDDNKNASIDDKITIREESETERINLLNDRTTNPLTKRIVRKNRIKRKSRRKWGRWTGWSSCSVTCGKGRQIRWRHCLRECSTVETEMEEKACQMPACPPGKFLGIF